MIKKILRFFSIATVFYIFLAFLLGVFTFFVPPFQKPDEPVHFYRVITLFNGQMSCKTEKGKYFFLLPLSVYNFPNSMFVREIPMSSNKFPITLLKQKFPWTQDKQIVNDFSYCTLPFYAYVPEIIATAFSYPFDNLLVTFFAMRFMNAVLFFFCVFLVQKIVGRSYGYIFWLFACTPMVLHQVTAVSYDAASLTLGMLVFAFFFSFISKKTISYKEATVFGVLLVLFNIVKSGYYPTTLLLIPIFMKMKITWDWKKITGGIFLLLVGLTVVIKEFFNLRFTYFFPFATMPQSLRFALIHPFYFMTVLSRTLEEEAGTLLYETVGRLGWIDYTVSPYIFAGYFVVLGAVIALYVQKNTMKISKCLLLLFWVVIISTVYFIFFHFYTAATPAAFYKIISVQGRYFLPIFPLVVVTIGETVLFFRKKLFRIMVSFCFLFVFVSFLLIRSIYMRYYDYSKQIINYNPLIEKIHSDALDIKTLKTIPIDTEKTFLIPTDMSLGSKISGFQFVPVNEFTVRIPYEFFIKDTTCTVTLVHGYLDRMRGTFLQHVKSPDDPVYTQFFPITPIHKNTLCFTLGPAMETVEDNEALKIYAEGEIPIIRFLYVIQ